MEFEKWQALGNDYVIVEAAALPFPLTPNRIRAICAPHTGVFADGVLLLSDPEQPGCLARLQVFNPDGSEAEISGNGAREAVLYLRHRGWADSDEFSLQTAAGVLHPRITSPTTASMDLGRARLASPDYPDGGPDGAGELTAAGRRWRFQHVNVGNPQCSIAVADQPELESLRLEQLGPEIEHHPLFPNRINVSWFSALEPDRIRARIFERGVGETSASGTGAAGAAVAHVLAQRARARESGLDPSPPAAGVTVVLDGGELEVEVGEDLSVALSGWARPVFRGRLSGEFLEELNATQ
ncbi:MAG TPA: diaminopimelate epimerase [Solirubrobacteraceae bacterium]|nr:diaminopimelate epimerase [Solirubrobacteraceae bacterium]